MNNYCSCDHANSKSQFAGNHPVEQLYGSDECEDRTLMIILDRNDNKKTVGRMQGADTMYYNYFYDCKYSIVMSAYVFYESCDLDQHTGTY